MRLARRRGASVLNAVLEQEQRRNLLSGIGVIDQYGPAFHEVVVLLTHEADHSLEQRVAWTDEGSDRLLVDFALLEADALVLLLDRCAAADLAVPFPNDERDVGDFPTAFLASFDLPAEALFLRTDPDRLTQVFINLIANARKYCDSRDPALRINVKQRGARVIVDFIDNGSGIPKGKQQIIFEKFARLTDQTRAGGAGLGLAICREIMANLGGTITYLPAQGGAAFRVTLPLRLEKSPRADAA